MNELQSINQQMALISNLARAYYNATPEQRANISLGDMQEQINRYNELKARRNELYAEQEARVQEELLAQRRAAEQTATINSRWTWRRTPKNNVVPETEIIQPTEPVNVVVTEQWVVVPTNNNNWYYVGPITWMRIRKPFTIGWKPIGNYNTSNSIIPEWIIVRHWGPTWESILWGENIVPVNVWTWTVNTWSTETFPIFFRNGSGQYYEFWDQWTIRWMTWMNNTWYNNSWFNYTWYVSPYFTWYKY